MPPRLGQSWIIGSDEAQFDLSCWSIENLERISSLPILVGTIGSWPKHRVDHILEKKTVAGVIFLGEGAAGWFQKPQLLLTALQICTDAAVWLDNDIEFRGPMDDIFDLIEEERLLMAYDGYANNLYKSLLTFNSGVVGAKVTDQGPPEILGEWADACRNPILRGDQEVLAGMLARMDAYGSIKILPKKYNFLRLEAKSGIQEPDDLRAVHWTGPVGKAHIRQKLMKTVVP